MTKRAFIKKSIVGITGLFFFTSSQKTITPKKEESSKSDAYAANMAFGHSLPHFEFNSQAYETTHHL